MFAAHSWILEYWNEIQNGNIVVSKKIYKLYARMVDDIHNPKNNWIYDPSYGNKVIDFVERFCKNSKAPFAGQPLKLLLWQKACIDCIYSFIDRHTKLRRYIEVFLEIARKNGKSTLIAALAFYSLFEESGAQIIAGANSLVQIQETLYGEACNMMLQSPALSAKVKKRKNDLFVPDNLSTFRAITNNPRTHDGLCASVGVVDEGHEQKTRSLYDVILQSQSTRNQPLMFFISTNGFVRDGLFDILYDYGERVLDNRVDDETFLPLFYELDNDDEVHDKSCWQKCNPSCPEVKRLDYLERWYNKAQNDTTAKRTCYTKDFNISMGANDTSNAYLEYEIINKAHKPFDLADFKGSYCCAGLDLSLSGDLTALTALMQHKGSDTLYIHQHFFLPEIGIEKRTEADYLTWAQQGYLTLCKDSKVIKTDDIIDYFVRLRDELKITPWEIGYDRWGSPYIVDLLTRKNFKVKNVGQGASISNPMKITQGLFLEGKIQFDNPITKWNLSNCNIKIDNKENWEPCKPKRNMRIDGVSSLLDAVFVYEENKRKFLSIIKEKKGSEQQ